ncbi:hypothetical protein NFI95_07545 [Acetobacteraceae bacterium KSS8]|uniref:Uncharacterized protein n=1 Tax=Endosaccharibacter trunci TaxID=2812733 RepID=A0ABT1W5Z7_9PROT|nr:hypothetical protein [Acetobacteraceae bacterium KSS8]
MSASASPAPRPVPSGPSGEIRRRRFGAAVCCVAGVWWCWAPAARLPLPPVAAHAALVIAAAALFAAASSAIRAYRGPAAPAVNRRLMIYAIAMEVVLILCGTTLAGACGRPDLVLPAIALPVGLHFLPLARAFGYPPYRVTGLAICGVVAVCLTLPRPLGSAMLGVGVGASLLLTALHMTVRLRRLSRGAFS